MSLHHLTKCPSLLRNVPLALEASGPPPSCSKEYYRLKRLVLALGGSDGRKPTLDISGIKKKWM